MLRITRVKAATIRCESGRSDTPPLCGRWQYSRAKLRTGKDSGEGKQFDLAIDRRRRNAELSRDEGQRTVAERERSNDCLSPSKRHS